MNGRLWSPCDCPEPRPAQVSRRFWTVALPLCLLVDAVIAFAVYRIVVGL